MQSRTLRVWDLPTRLFHWSVVVLVVLAYLTWRFDWMDWHARTGEVLLGLGCFRILWGFLGSDTARFARFVTGPRAALRHLRAGLRREPDRQIGHNPAGGWMVLLLLALLLGETLSGLYIYTNVAEDGPLTAHVPAAVANAITTLHALLWDALLAAVALHLLAIITYAVAKGQNLLRPMLTGRKSLAAGADAQPRMAAAGRAWWVAGCSAGAAALLVYLLSA